MTFLQAIRRPFAGKSVCCIGGGPVSDLPECDIYISANEHGARLRRVDFVVAVDTFHGITRKPMRAHIRDYSDAPMIGPQRDADVRLKWWPGCPERLLSGVTAVYVAAQWRARSIHLVGFSDRQGQRRQMDMIAPYIDCPVYGSPYGT